MGRCGERHAAWRRATSEQSRSRPVIRLRCNAIDGAERQRNTPRIVPPETDDYA
ncbi:hypothetical protein JGU72_11840 [Antrihabitans sp. YC2-6]|nr:hypothetical protein [Antrihabitans sp. YC2-6]